VNRGFEKPLLALALVMALMLAASPSQAQRAPAPNPSPEAVSQLESNLVRGGGLRYAPTCEQYIPAVSRASAASTKCWEGLPNGVHQAKKKGH
jgi:hypothetical protein